tara:strand:+ start:329 stop:616 length:288 start_codon:yes stop_codon:yes gene_type:complete
MRQYPIWCNINSCAYSQKQGGSSGNKSYGIKEHGECEIVIGTSSRNSHHFLNHKTTHRLLDNGDRSYRFYVDGVVIKEAILKKGAEEITIKEAKQ